MPNRLLLHLADHEEIRRWVTRSPLAKPLVQRFVAGESLDEAVEAARRLAGSGIGAILDHLGEHSRTESEADAAASDYVRVLGRIGAAGLDAHISVKLTQLGLDLSAEGALQRVSGVCQAARLAGATVAIDMESSAYTDRTIEVYRRVRESHSNLVLCLQARLRRTPADLESLLPLRPVIRLCKGAYEEPREGALGFHQTRTAFRMLLSRLLREAPHTAVATHDDHLVREAFRTAKRYALAKERFEFQFLYGVRRELQSEVAARGCMVRSYIPFGPQWYPYLMRRLAERPANLRLLAEALVRG